MKGFVSCNFLKQIVFFFRRVLSDLLLFDPLKNETLLEQSGTEA